MREPAPTPYEIIARNIRVKLALRIKGKMDLFVEGNVIRVVIECHGLTFRHAEIIKDLNEADSSLMSENIYKLYRKFIMKKFFTFD